MTISISGRRLNNPQLLVEVVLGSSENDEPGCVSGPGGGGVKQSGLARVRLRYKYGKLADDEVQNGTSPHHEARRRQQIGKTCHLSSSLYLRKYLLTVHMNGCTSKTSSFGCESRSQVFRLSRLTYMAYLAGLGYFSLLAYFDFLVHQLPRLVSNARSAIDTTFCHPSILQLTKL